MRDLKFQRKKNYAINIRKISSYFSLLLKKPTKRTKAGNYEDAKDMMKYIMAESRRLYDRMSEDKSKRKQKEQMNSLMSDMKDTELMTALVILSSILKEYYGKKLSY